MIPDKTALAKRLLEVVGNKKKVLVLCHNNPDPDTMGSGFALQSLLQKTLGRRTVLGYGGFIGRAENRQLVKRLKIPLVHSSELDFTHFSVICLVDSQPSTGNNMLPSRVIPHIVIDHHPLRRASQASAFADIRPDYGSTATIIAEYYRLLGIELERKVATALFYGLKTDTNNLLRSKVKADLEAFNFIFPQVDQKALAAIENPPIPQTYFMKLSETLDHATYYKDVLISDMGNLHHPESVAEMAEFLLRIEGIRWTLCLGDYKNTIYLSIRTSRRGWYAGTVASKIVRGIGNGGGHEKTAGGQVPLDSLNQEQRKAVRSKVIKRFLSTQGINLEQSKLLIHRPNQDIVAG